jgi:hypothetical protein
MAIRWFDPTEPKLEQQAMQQRRFEITRAAVTPEFAQRVTYMFQTNPNLRPGTGLALAQANVDPEGPIARAAVVAEAKRQQVTMAKPANEKGLLGGVSSAISDAVGKGVGFVSDTVGESFGDVGDVIKGVSRGADIGLSSIGQTFQGAFRESVRDNDISGAEWLLGLPHLAEGFRQSDVAVAHQHVQDRGGYAGLVTGDTDVDYGSGFFAGGAVKAEGVRRRREATPLIDGHAASMGRYAANQVFEPGSIPYTLLSGTIDGGVVLATDPTNWLGGGVRLGSRGVREGIERGKTFQGSTGTVVRETRTAVEDSPAKATARAFGDDEITAEEFLERAVEFGSDNPEVASTIRSLDEGLLSREDAAGRLTTLKDRIKVEAGVVEGVRKTVLSDVSNDWLTMNRRGRQFVRWAAQSTSIAEMRRATKGKVDVATLNRLAATRDENEVIDIVGPMLGVQIRERPIISAADRAIAAGDDSFKVRVKRARASSRWAHMMPHQVVDLEDLDDVVEQTERMGRLVNMPLDAQDGFVNRMAASTNRNERLQVTKDLMAYIQNDVLAKADPGLDALRTSLTESRRRLAVLERRADEAGPDEVAAELRQVRDRVAELERTVRKRSPRGQLDAQSRKNLTRIYGAFDDMDEFRTYALTELGQPMKVPGAPVLRVGDEEVALPSPHLLSEHVGQYMPLPDPRELRRATSKMFGTLRKIPGASRSSDALIHLGEDITKVFKTGALARFAYPIRVIGEEQGRMAASGLYSSYAHPLSYISIMTGRSMDRDILGDAFTESNALADALSAGSAGMFGESGKVRVPGKFAVDRTDPNFARALVDNLSEYNNDDLARRVANGGLLDGDVTPNPLPGVDGLKDWFWDGEGRALRELLSTGSSSRGATATREQVFATKFDPNDPVNSADGYVDSMVERLRIATNSDPRLMEVIVTGVIDGEPLMRQVAPKVFKPNPAAVKKVQAILDEGPEIGPAYAKGDIFLNPKSSDPSFARLGRAYDAGVERMFEYLMSKPTNTLSRSPAFRQFYWKRQAELIRYMQPEVQQAALDVARSSNLPKQVLKRLEEGAAARSGDLTAKEADQLAKAFGVDSTRKLLYDLHNRNYFWDALRIVFPFGHAFQEVARTWARIGFTENPLVFRRGQQIVNGLRSANIDGEDEGLFYTNENGEEVFALPWSGWITEKLTGIGMPVGVNAPLTAPVKGLNVFGSSVVPGLGPVVTMPLSKIIPNRPEYEDVQQLLFPFGEEEYSDGVLGGFTGSLMPAWADKIKTAFSADPNDEDDRIFANHVAYAGRYLLSTGKYDVSSAEDMDRLDRDQITMARRLFMIRGLAQVWAPSAPTQEYVTLDRNGEGVLQARMVEEYQKLLNDDYKTATQRFVEKFGEDAVLTMVNRSAGGAPPTTATNTFAKQNPDVVRTYRDVYGFFLPREGEFSYQAYKDQFATGEREQTKPREAIEIANQRLGQMVYNQYKAQVGERPSREQQAWLRGIREKLEQEYPGYNSTPANLRDTKVLITKMVEAAQNPVLAETEAGQGLTLYLNYREQAMQAAKDRGLASFSNAGEAADLRQWLRDIAVEIEARYPAFGELFERTFNREMVNDDGA